MTDLLPYLLAFVIFLVIVFRDALNRPSPGDADQFTRNDERCQVVRVKQHVAVQRMKRLGHKSLLDGRPAWRTVNPMGVRAEPSKVVPLRRKK